jgi:hypothetical protein
LGCSYLEVLRLLFLFPPSVDLLKSGHKGIEAPVVYQLPVLLQIFPAPYVEAPPLGLQVVLVDRVELDQEGWRIPLGPRGLYHEYAGRGPDRDPLPVPRPLQDLSEP